MARQLQAEVQGAMVEGELGIAFPLVEKIMKYVQLAKLLLEERRSSRNQVQVVEGGVGSSDGKWRFGTRAL